MSYSRLSFAGALAISLLFSAHVPAASAQQKPAAEKKDIPAIPEGALAPDNLKKPRPKPPFDLTGP